MSAYLDHIAVNTAQFDEALHFYETVFGMTVSRTVGDKPCRKAWFHQGIQLNEVCSATKKGCQYDHIALRTENLTDTLTNAQRYGGKLVEEKSNWIIMSDGIVIELIG